MQEPIRRVLREIFLECAKMQLHVHAPVRKHQGDQIPEYLHYRDSFFLTGTTSKQELPKLKIREETVDGIRNILLLISILWYYRHGVRLLAW